MTPCRQSEGDRDPLSAGEMVGTEHWSPLSAGYLSSFLALETGVGLQSCPWLVDVPPGRQINVTLLSFGEPWPAPAALATGCEWTIVVREGNITTHLPGCVGGGGDLAAGGRRRQRVLYTSHQRGTSLSVFLRPTSTSTTLRSHLLIHFHGSHCASSIHREP